MVALEHNLEGLTGPREILVMERIDVTKKGFAKIAFLRNICK